MQASKLCGQKTGGLLIIENIIIYPLVISEETLEDNSFESKRRTCETRIVL